MPIMKTAFACIVICLANAISVYAHPHVFVEATLTVDFNEKGFSGLINHWVYDEMYSVAMMAAVDTDKDGKFSGAELKQLQENILDPIKGDNYYNYVLLESSFLKAGNVKKFAARFDNHRLILDFEVEFVVPVERDYTMIVAVVADPSNYIQVTSDLEKAEVKAPDEIDVEYFNDGLQGLTMFRAFQPDVEGLFLRFKK